MPAQCALAGRGKVQSAHELSTATALTGGDPGADDSGMPEHLHESDNRRRREAGNSGHDASIIACPKKQDVSRTATGRRWRLSCSPSRFQPDDRAMRCSSANDMRKARCP